MVAGYSVTDDTCRYRICTTILYVRPARRGGVVEIPTISPNWLDHDANHILRILN